MDRTRFRVPAAAILSILLPFALQASLVRGGKGERAPYRLGVAVQVVDRSGPETWREELEEMLLRSLESQACFESVELFDADAADPPELVFLVGVTEYRDETTYAISMATLSSPDTPPDTRQQVVAHLETMLHLELRKLPEGVTLRSRRLGEGASHKPVMNEDPRSEVRSRVLESATRNAASFACKGSRKKLEKTIARALAKAEKPQPPSR